MLELVRPSAGERREGRDAPHSAAPELKVAPAPSWPIDKPEAVVEAFLHLPDAIVMVDPTGNIVWGNPSAERMFERSIADTVGRSGLDLVHPDDQELVLRSLSTIQGRDVGTPIEIRINAASGWRLVEVVGTTVQWYGESTILLCMRDLTERRRYEVGQGHEAQMRSLVHNAGYVLMQVSSDGTLESVSGAITRLLGHDPELVQQQPLIDLVAHEDRERLRAALAAAARGASAANPVTTRLDLLRHDGGGTVPFELSIVNLLDDPTVEGFVISAHDATAQVSAEHELSEALSRLTATLESTADGILVVSTDGRITGSNRRFAEIWHLPEELVAEQNNAGALAFALDQLTDPEASVSEEERRSFTSEYESFTILEFRDGRVVERASRPQRVNGRVVGRVMSFRDVTDRKRLEDELAYRAFHDPLTGLANKALFQDRLDHALARLERSGAHLAVLFIDLDNFKTVNDSLGHGEGDDLLKRVAGTLAGCLRPADTAARLGGDEFAVLIEDVRSHDVVIDVAQRLLESLRPPVRLGSKSVSSAGSIGIAFDVAGITSEQLLRNADIAMYKAKELGKDRFEVYRDEMHASVLARIELEDDLREAILAENLLAHYQPIVDLHTHRVVGFEALVRWSHPRGGLVDPGFFVPLAEELGLVGQIDTFVLGAACRQARQWLDAGLAGPDLMMSVNLSAGRLVEPTLAEQIAAQVHDCGFDPGSLILEITESAILTDNDTTVRNLSALRALGVRIALDDFGTGYSTFSHLDRLQIDIVKIDKSFVQTAGAGNSNSLAAAMVQLAGTLGYRTIAEGIENAAQEEALRALGCGLAQGYHLGRPLDAEAATRLLASPG